ncbi:putative manganese transporter [Haladaptatus caseinilyticus]|uniref:putative manganese transporter n=1 Tax=Haladaptatus caseinilyticus TaxID=2993314 RepID=UPI00224A504C|nr:putative manganese transporter [Haladaptatus caseinilyticus]
MNEIFEVFLASVRDGYVQVSAFVAITVLLFGLIQYRTSGALVERLSENDRLQPLFGALMGLTPGCGGAIVMMPLYVRGTVGFGTVVATLIATAGDSAFVILALAPEAALYAYGIAFATAIISGYAIDRFGMGVGRIDDAVANISNTATDGGVVSTSRGGNPTHEYDTSCETSAARESSVLTPLSHAVHAVWWVAAGIALVLGVVYLLAGAPDVPLALGPTYAGAFTVVGVTGTATSFYIYFVGRHYLGDGHVGRARDTFATVYETLVHAAQETSFVTVWVLTAYLLYEYSVLLFNINIGEIATSVGVMAPIVGALIGLIPGCGPQIVLASVYAEGGIPFSALTANAISQDGDALFPLIAIDKKAAIVASIYTTIPALIVGIALHVLFDFGSATGFGVLG